MCYYRVLSQYSSYFDQICANPAIAEGIFHNENGDTRDIGAGWLCPVVTAMRGHYDDTPG
jgi:hypothetical protein